jgi:hypothetical protein
LRLGAVYSGDLAGVIRSGRGADDALARTAFVVLNLNPWTG